MLELDLESRTRLWERLIATIEDYTVNVGSARVTPPMEPEKIRALLEPLTFERPLPPLDAVDFVARNLWRYQTHTPHPRYFGLFNPAPTTMGIAGDALTAAFNPQIAAWAHSPFAAEVESHLVRSFGERFGYDPATTDGVFCTGGAEANHTALLTALTHSFPAYREGGVRALAAQPVFYASEECHHSFLKAAQLCGIGSSALHTVPVDSNLRMEPDSLAERLRSDRKLGLAPFLIVATAGTTNAGVIDSLQPLADLAQHEGLWYHIDAAWGGAAAISRKLRHLLQNAERADSITFDAHKWLSAPMGAGVYLTRHPDILRKTFSTPTAYMPRDAAGLAVTDPHLHSMQWSRRFVGLKVFLSLLVAGWDGYAATVDRMTEAGGLLRRELKAEGWEIVNRTPLPVVCFTDSRLSDVEPVVQSVVQSGEAWISTTRIRGRSVARACITNFRTTAKDVRALVALAGDARESALASERRGSE